MPEETWCISVGNLAPGSYKNSNEARRETYVTGVLCGAERGSLHIHRTCSGLIQASGVLLRQWLLGVESRLNAEGSDSTACGQLTTATPNFLQFSSSLKSLLLR